MEVRNQRTNKPDIMMMMINKTITGPKNKLRKLKFQKKTIEKNDHRRNVNV